MQDTTIRTLVTEGVFARYRGETDVLDAVIDDEGRFHYRYFPLWEPHGLWGTLDVAPNGGWSGVTSAKTPCGYQDITINVQR